MTRYILDDLLLEQLKGRLIAPNVLLIKRPSMDYALVFDRDDFANVLSPCWTAALDHGIHGYLREDGTIDPERQFEYLIMEFPPEVVWVTRNSLVNIARHV